MNRDISIYVGARKQSRRCPNKMLRPFAGTTLIEICLEKLNSITEYPVFFAVGERDIEFQDIAQHYSNINILQRSQQSVDSDDNPRLVFESFKQLPTPEVCFLNPCHSFLRVETVLKALQCFTQSNIPSLTSVTRRRGWFYGEDKQALTNLGGNIDTSVSNGLYEVAHAFHLYNWRHMFQTGRYWNNTENNPFLFPIPPEEGLDIDTENDFTMVEALYKSHLHVQKTKPLSDPLEMTFPAQ